MRFYCILLFWIAMVLPSMVTGFVGSTREIVIFSEYGRNETIQKSLHQDPREPMRPSGLGAASNLLLTALYQEVPVLVPAPLWQSIVDHKQFFDLLTGPLSDKELYARYQTYERFKNKDDLISLRAYFRHVQEAYTQTQKSLQTAPTLETFKRELEYIKNSLLKKNCLKKSGMDDLKWLEVTRFALCAFLPLERYLVKEISQKAPFYLFIPKKLLTHTQQQDQKGLSAQEKSLGLKINSFATVHDPYSVKAPTMHYSPDFLEKALEQIFIKKNDVSAHEAQRWTIFIMGHGTFSEEAHDSLKKVKHTLKKIDRKKKHLEKKIDEPRIQTTLASLEKHRSQFMRKAQELEEANKIIGLPIEFFQRLIYFCEKRIDTGLFFYSSCSAGGKHGRDAFDQEGKQMCLSFPVLIDTLLEAPAFTFPSELRLESCVEKTMPLLIDKLVDWKDRRIILDAPYDFQAFFSSAHAPKPALSCVSDCIVSMTTFLKKASGLYPRMQPNDVNNVVSIRLPGDTHFCAVDVAHLFCKATREAFTVPSDKQIVFFTQPEMVKIDLTRTKTCPYFCSLIPGKAMHIVGELHAPSYTLTEITQHFFPVEELNVSKLIRIETLRCKNEKNILTTYSNVYLFNRVPHPRHPTKHAPGSGIFLTHNQKGHRALWPFFMASPYLSLEEHDLTQTKIHVNHVETFFKDANSLQNNIPDDKYVLSVSDLCKRLNLNH